jgi:Ubiquitin family
MVKGLEGKTIMIGTETHPITEQTTVQKFRTLIKEKNGIPEDKQLLIFAGKPLVDLNPNTDVPMQLLDYGIRNLSTVHLALRLLGGSESSTARSSQAGAASAAPNFEIRVQICNNEEVKLQVNDQMTIQQLKNAVAKKNNCLSESTMCLNYAGITLDSSKTIKSYNIPNAALIL